DRLEQAQKLTADLIDNLDDYRRQLNRLENESQLSAMDDRLGLNESPEHLDNQSSTMIIYDRLVYNLPMIYLNRLNQLRDEYEQNVLNGIITNMLSLTVNNNQTLAFEQLNEKARIEIPGRMTKLQHLLEQYQHHF
ncbi:hypothetical protein BLA29_014050, partial [Euroglyphus maynei]